MLFPAVNFLKCVVTEVILFLIVAFKIPDISRSNVMTHLRCGAMFSAIRNFPLILTAKYFLNSVNI